MNQFQQSSASTSAHHQSADAQTRHKTQMSPADQEAYDRCLVEAKDLIYRAKCVTTMFRVRDKIVSSDKAWSKKAGMRGNNRCRYKNGCAAKTDASVFAAHQFL